MASLLPASLLKLLLCFLHLLSTLSEALLLKEEKTEMAFWKDNLPEVVMPEALRDLVSPLSPSLTLLYLSRLEKAGALSDSIYGKFCSTAEISCFNKTKYMPDPLVCIPYFEYSYGIGKRHCKHSERGIFFTRNKLKIGASFLYPNFTDTLAGQHFLPKALADAFPFYIDGIMAVQNLLGIKDFRDEMENTIEQCTAPATSGEIKECSSSLESMVLFAKHTLGSKVRVYSPSTWMPMSQAKVKEVSEASAVGRRLVTCHNLEYPYLIYSCHMSRTSRMMEVSMVEHDEGEEWKGLAICHSNTTAWNPHHVAFEVLQNVKPGDGQEICHWIPQNHFVWTIPTS